MDGALPSDSVTVAVLASRVDRYAPEHLDGVLAWTGSGVRHYQPMSSTLASTSGEDRVEVVGLDRVSLTATPPSSSGLTWRTWTLPTIPPSVRHLPPAEAVRVMARALRQVTP